MSRQKAIGRRQEGRRVGRPARAFRRAYTLTEIMIVISIIVLLLAMAVPALKFITGGKSVEAAENQIAAILGRARAEAIAKQKVAGVMFYLDMADGRTKAVLVEQADASVTVPGGAPPWSIGAILDLAVDQDGNPVSDPFLLPPGMSVQLIDNCVVDTTLTPPARQDDGYIGYNSRNLFASGVVRTYDPTLNPPRLGVKYGGVLLFDASGRLVSRSYAFHTVNTSVTPNVYTKLGQLLLGKKEFDVVSGSNDQFVIPATSAATNANPPILRSQFGLVIYDREAATAQGFSDEDSQVEAGGSAVAVKSLYTNPNNTTVNGVSLNPEKPEEQWLDENATPLILNRYNGSIVRAE